MIFLILNLFLSLGGMTNSFYHPVHVTVCNLELNDEENIVAVKLFKDDFALVLRNNYQEEVHMENADNEQNRKLISRYINSCLQIIVNKNKTLELEYKYSKVNEEAIWIFFKTGELRQIRSLVIRNTLMLDLWDDQTNLMIISRNGKENGYRFNKRQTEIEIDLNR